MNPRLRSILVRENVPEGISGREASGLEAGQPFHRDGLLVLRQHPSLAVIVVLQSCLVGCLMYEFIAIALNLGRLPAGDSRLFLLANIVEWLQQHFKVLQPGSDGEFLRSMVSSIVALVPWLMVLNLSWALICGVISDKPFRWRWLASALFGVIPLRVISPWFFRKWIFWREDPRLVLSAEARLLQYTIVFRLVNEVSADCIKDRWFSVLDSRIRDVTDSYFSYLHVPGWISLGLYGLAYVAFSSGMWFLFPFRLEYVVVGWMVYLTVNRSLLGLATFRWLADPSGSSAPMGNWRARAIGIALYSLFIASTCVLLYRLVL